MVMPILTGKTMINYWFLGHALLALVEVPKFDPNPWGDKPTFEEPGEPKKLAPSGAITDSVSGATNFEPQLTNKDRNTHTHIRITYKIIRLYCICTHGTSRM